MPITLEAPVASDSCELGSPDGITQVNVGYISLRENQKGFVSYAGDKYSHLPFPVESKPLGKGGKVNGVTIPAGKIIEVEIEKGIKIPVTGTD